MWINKLQWSEYCCIHSLLCMLLRMVYIKAREEHVSSMTKSQKKAEKPGSHKAMAILESSSECQG